MGKEATVEAPAESVELTVETREANPSQAATSGDEFNFPAATPLAEMTVEQQAEYWREKARKHELLSKQNVAEAQRAAALRKEIDDLKKAQMSETEKAIAEAENRGRQGAVAEFSQKIAAAKLESALVGKVPDPSAIVADLNLSKYITDTGDVDEAAVLAFSEKYAALGAANASQAKAAPDLKQGRQGQIPAQGQLTRGEIEALAKSDPFALDVARREGRCNEVLGIK